MPNFSADQKGTLRDSKRKEARYKLASLLTQERFEEAVHLADTYFFSDIVHLEDHTFVIDIAFAAETLAQKNGG
jgi:hypothetical protein